MRRETEPRFAAIHVSAQGQSDTGGMDDRLTARPVEHPDRQHPVCEPQPASVIGQDVVFTRTTVGLTS